MRRWLPRSWRIRCLLLAGLALVMLLAGDRVAAGVAARMVADRVSCATGLTTPPSVRIGGPLFLPQVVAGRFSDIGMTAHDVPRNGIRLDTVNADLRGASLPDGHGMHAAHVTVDVTVGYAVLPAEVGGQQVTYRAEGGLLAVDTALDVAGRPVPVTVLIQPQISQNAITLAMREVEVLGVRAPAAALRDTGFGADISRPLPALPAGLRYRSVTATDAGLRIGVAGDDITLPSTSPNACRSAK